MAGYIVKITLEQTHPPVWRRVILPKNITFSTLHAVIQNIYGWEDTHLHDFRTNDGKIVISMEEDGFADYPYKESDTRVNEFLEQCKWIRYTYDFGNEWRHKIVLEKTDPSWSFAYASVLKYKGDNFIEDFFPEDDDWEDEEDYNEYGGKLTRKRSQKNPEPGRSLFEPDKVNDRLRNLNYQYLAPVTFDAPEDCLDHLSGNRRQTDGSPENNVQENQGAEVDEEFIKEMFDHISPEDTEAILQALIPWANEMNRLSDINRQLQNADPHPAVSKEKTPSKIERMISEFWDFCMDQQEEKLSAPTSAGHFHWALTRDFSSTVQQNLMQLSRQELLDYCRYWGITTKASASKTSLAELLRQLFFSKPLNLCFLFSEEELSELLYIQEKQSIRLLFSEVQNFCIIKAILAGLIQVTITLQDNEKTAVVLWASDTDDILNALKSQTWKRKIRQIQSSADKIEQLLALYGIMDFDSLYEKLQKLWKIRPVRNDFERILYCRFTLPSKAETAYCSLDKRRYIIDNKLDKEYLIRKMFLFASDIEWYPFSAEDSRKASLGWNLLYPCWDFLASSIVSLMKYPQDKLSELMNKLYAKARAGVSSTEIMADLISILQIKTPSFSWYMWDSLMTCCMDTGLPMLRGYSRRKLAELKEMPASIYDLFDQSALTSSIKKDTPIYLMPSDIQLLLYGAYEIPDCDKSVSEILEILKELSVENYEIRYMAAVRYFDEGQFRKAESLLAPLKREIGSRDPYLKKMMSAIQNFRKQAQEEAQEDFFFENMFAPVKDMIPYQREAKKPGRNDPCPCGSGKKYKRCCGR